MLARDVVIRGDAPFDARALLAALDARDPRIAVFGVDGMVGASPETLIRVRDGRFRVRVLAGTGPAGTADALMASGKDRAEHAFAVESVLVALGGHVRDVEAPAVPFALELPRLTHLATDVSGVVADGSGVLDLVAESGLPVVVVTTSGTAVANLHPAALEAFHQGVPLVLLTGDRPEELRGVGANQTTTQPGIFADAVGG